MEAASSPSTVRYYGLSDIGVVREENQDSLLLREPEDAELRWTRGMLLAVADGMGGLQGGKTASELTIQALDDRYYSEEGEVADALREAVEEANRRIFQYARNEGGGQAMGSTVTALALLKNYALIAQVGDSRAYRHRGGELRQLTRDHSLYRELQETGQLPADSEAYQAHRNVLTRGLGLRERVEVDIFELDDLEPGDLFLLSSDGMHEVVGEEAIAAAISKHGEDIEALCRDLVQQARARGGPDNITVLVALLGSPGGWAAAQGAGGASDLGRPSSWFLPLAFFLAFMAGVGATLLFEDRPPAGERALPPGWFENVRRHLESRRASHPEVEEELEALRRFLDDEGDGERQEE